MYDKLNKSTQANDNKLYTKLKYKHRACIDPFEMHCVSFSFNYKIEVDKWGALPNPIHERWHVINFYQKEKQNISW